MFDCCIDASLVAKIYCIVRFVFQDETGHCHDVQQMLELQHILFRLLFYFLLLQTLQTLLKDSGPMLIQRIFDGWIIEYWFEQCVFTLVHCDLVNILKIYFPLSKSMYSDANASKLMNLMLWTLQGDVSRSNSGALVVYACVWTTTKNNPKQSQTLQKHYNFKR